MSTRQVHHIDDHIEAAEEINAFTGIIEDGNGKAAYNATGNRLVDAIALNDADAGEPVHILKQGMTSLKIGTASSISEGDIISVDTSGEGITDAGTSGDEANILALEDAGADGDLIGVYFDKYNKGNENITA